MGLARLSGVEEYTLDDGRLVLFCSVETDTEAAAPAYDEPVPLTFTFHSGSVLNIFVSPHRSRDEYASALDLDYESVASPVALTADQTDGKLVVASDRLIVSVDLETAEFSVSDDNPLLEPPDSLTDNRGRYLAKPLGFTEAETENWPLQVTETHASVRLGPEEHVFGLGERFGQIEHTGESLTARVTQSSGTMSDSTYKSVPFYVSDRGYGLLVETTSDVTYDFGASAVNAIEIVVDDTVFSTTVFAGPSPKEILERYTAVTGRPPRLPGWTYGLWTSRASYESGSEVLDVASRFRELSIPCDVVHVDPEWMATDGAFTFDWDEEAFDDLGEFTERLDEHEFKLSVWEYPYLKDDSPLFEEAATNGYLLTDKNGDPYVLRRPSSSDLPLMKFGIVDFTDEDACEWWGSYHRELIADGVDVFKLDFAEYVPTDAGSASGRLGGSLHNVYPTLYADAVSDAFEAVDQPPVLWVRAGWAGSQRFPVHWGGDPFASRDALAASIRGALSLTFSGYQFWSCDVGGFHGEPDPELYIRWLQWSLLGLSHVRLHGTSPREPWEFGDVATTVAREYVTERYRLFPYIYSYAEQAHRRGIPLTRHMWLESPDFPAAKQQRVQHFFGENLLVVPVLDPDGTVEITFPAGEWVDYWTGEYVTGPGTETRQVDLTELPVYVRGGSVLPVQDPGQSIDSGTPESLTFEVYPNRDCGTDTTFPFYHEESDQVVPVTADISPSHRSVRLSVPSRDLRETATVRIKNPRGTPERISVNGTPVGRTDRTWQEGDLVVKVR